MEKLNESDQVTTGFSFVCDWSREWHMFLTLITEHSEAKTMYSRTTFNTQLEIAQ